MGSGTFSKLFQEAKRSNFRVNGPLYDRLLASFAERDISLVELGFNNPSALEVWADYLSQDSRIIGIQTTSEEKIKNTNLEAIEIHEWKQRDQFFWEAFFANTGLIDVLVINFRQFRSTLTEILDKTVNKINYGGIIMIEDDFSGYHGTGQNDFVKVTREMVNYYFMKYEKKDIYENLDLFSVEIFPSILVFKR